MLEVRRNMFIMKKNIENGRHILGISLLSILTISATIIAEQPFDQQSTTQEALHQHKQSYVINNISIQGINLINEVVFRKNLLFCKGSHYSDEIATSSIKQLNTLGYFETIQIYKKILPNNLVDILIKVKEKALLTGYEFYGNKHMGTKKLSDILNLKNLKTVSNHDIKVFKKKILQEYHKANYFNVNVDITANMSSEEPAKAFLQINITEGAYTRLKTVNFLNCKNISSSVLRNKVFTKEDWLFACTNQAGTFNKDMLEMDKSIIHRIYADKGYYKATVDNITINKNVEKNELQVNFHINEGQLHKIRFIDTQESDEFSEQELKQAVLLHKGDTFSATKLLDSLERIKNMFGAKGYIFCDVYPEIKPVSIDNEQYLDIKFMIEKGSVFKINDIKITGNKNTKEYVVRRELLIHEGGIANKVAMNLSLDRIESLGYFDRHNIDWKISRIGEDLIDLELNLIELRTGEGSLGIVSSNDNKDEKNNALCFKASAGIKKRNFLGRGWDVGLNAEIGQHKLNRGRIDFYNPAVNNSNIFFGSSGYISKSEYTGLGKAIETFPMETIVGANLRTGFYFLPETYKIQTAFDIGIESIDFTKISLSDDLKSKPAFKFLLNDRLKSGSFNWIGMSLIKNNLNHPLYPSKGWRLELNNKLALPAFNNYYSMFKTELSGHYFIPIIGKDRLVFSSFGSLGFVTPLNNSLPVPFKELFLMGGLDSLRGFRWGEAGPTYNEINTPIGGTKSLLLKFELITPLTYDKEFDINVPRGYLFYDIGTAWDAPTSYVFNDDLKIKEALFKPEDLIKNKFSPRQSVGIGLKFTRPQPIRIEWGYKLDRDYKAKERAYEWHFFMNIPID